MIFIMPSEVSRNKITLYNEGETLKNYKEDLKMNEFNNKMVETRFGKIEVSRIIASWHNLGGITGTSYRRNRNFDEWMHRCGISEEDRRFIRNFAGSGKLELEELAEKFMKELNETEF